MRLGECKTCGEQIYYRGRESDWRITYVGEPRTQEESPWVHKDWTKHALPGEEPTDHELPAYDHAAEPVMFTHLLVIEIDSYLAESIDTFHDVSVMGGHGSRKLVGHKILGKDMP